MRQSQNQLNEFEQPKTKTRLGRLAKPLALGGAVTAGSLTALPAYALDHTEIVNTIKGASVTIDAVGLAIITVVTGMLVLSLVVGMLMRKGK